MRGSKTYTISETSSSADTKIKTNTNTITVNIPSQPVKIPAHSKITIYNNSWKNNIQIILNIFQKVEGTVSAKIINENNNETVVAISIKDVMKALLEKSILPSKIKINNDDSINFCYDIKIKKEIIIHSTKIGKIIPLNV
ncbi:ETX/MTX2 family pore-forming toxin [Spiroplasma endosymbiont of Polydrusus formosus]|uniref:ETX/MTX2 family pore-forming toxin n=1 Tax=Spiroplasma endosymbiont of Polydrusus formosus TaxID=3139326 RepID=UPI0035B5489F